LAANYDARKQQPDFVRNQSDSVRKFAVSVRKLAHSVRTRFIEKIVWRGRRDLLGILLLPLLERLSAGIRASV
jgi:hypothetical protein